MSQTTGRRAVRGVTRVSHFAGGMTSGDGRTPSVSWLGSRRPCDAGTQARMMTSPRDQLPRPWARNDRWRTRYGFEQTREKERTHLRRRSRRSDQLHPLAEVAKKVSDLQDLKEKMKDVMLGAHRRGWRVGTGSATKSRRLRTIERSCHETAGPCETVACPNQGPCAEHSLGDGKVVRATDTEGLPEIPSGEAERTTTASTLLSVFHRLPSWLQIARKGHGSFE